MPLTSWWIHSVFSFLSRNTNTDLKNERIVIDKNVWTKKPIMPRFCASKKYNSDWKSQHIIFPEDQHFNISRIYSSEAKELLFFLYFVCFSDVLYFRYQVSLLCFSDLRSWPDGFFKIKKKVRLCLPPFFEKSHATLLLGEKISLSVKWASINSIFT